MQDGVSYAEEEDRARLSELWKASFQEEDESLRYFFRALFRPEDCLAYRSEGKLCAALYLLPAQLVVRGRREQVHYIYAAATFPACRSRGFMGALLRAAAEKGLQRGDRYSLLLPSEPSLYGYYGKCGYAAYFQNRELVLPYAEMCLAPPPDGMARMTPPQIQAARARKLQKMDGAVLWDVRHIRYAVYQNRAYGGRTVFGPGGSYAFCEPAQSECGARMLKTCVVHECMADPQSFPALAAQIARTIRADQYRLVLPPDSPLFPGKGERKPHGMLRPLGTQSVCDAGSPYLGLALE